MLTCQRCGRQNVSDAIFCNRCGARMQTGGVFYRNRHQPKSGGAGQLLLGLSILLLTALVLTGGTAVFLLSSPAATPTAFAVLPTGTPTLPPFVQPTATPTLEPTPSPSPSPTPFLTLTPLPTPSATATASPTEPPTPGPTPTPRPTKTPRPTPTPAPTPTPVNCSAATGTPDRTLFLGYGNAAEAGPDTMAWCVDRATFRLVTGSTWGTVRLQRNSRTLADFTCSFPDICRDPVVVDFANPRLVKPGQVLRYQFICVGDGIAENGDECADGTPDGATIEINYERVDTP